MLEEASLTFKACLLTLIVFKNKHCKAEALGHAPPPMFYTEYQQKDAEYLKVSYDDVLGAVKFYGERNDKCNLSLEELSARGREAELQAALDDDVADIKVLYNPEEEEARAVRATIDFFRKRSKNEWVRGPKIKNPQTPERSDTALGSKEGKKGKKEKGTQASNGTGEKIVEA
jgi:hypothetical protein